MTRNAKAKEYAEIKRRGLPTESHPARALELLHDRDLLAWAACPWSNSYWHHARTTSKGRDGQTVLEAFPAPEATTLWMGRAEEFLRLDVSGMKARVPHLKAASIPKKPVWAPDYDERVTRDIVIPCVLRRVLSAHVAYILSITAPVSEAAMAYVPGLPAPVSTIVREVASHVRARHYYYAKFDIRDAFNTVPWSPLRRALERLEYPRKFVDTVMVLTQAPVERWVCGRWLEQPRWRGAPAGLPESGVLLNLLLREVDDQIACGCVVYYRRYSDDLIFVGRTRGEVARAAKLFLNWAWRIGFQVKGVPRRSDLSRWIKDIRQQRLELLGVEIDHQADVHIPQSKVDNQLAKLDFYEELALRTPPLIVGPSKYAAGASRRAGVSVADQDDLFSLIDGFHQNWFPFNSAEAQLFRSSASARVPFGNLRHGDGPHRKLFAAVLGSKSPQSPSRAEGCLGSPHTCSQDGIARDVLPIVEECLELDQQVQDADHRRSYMPECVMVGDSTEAGGSFPLSSGGDGRETEHLLGLGSSSSQKVAFERNALDVESSVTSVTTLNGFDRGASGGRIAVAASDLAPATPADHPALDMGWSAGALANAVYCFAETRAVDDETTVTGFQEFEDNGLGLQALQPCVRIHTDTEAAVAYVNAIAARRRAAAARGRAFVVLGASWLPKQLLVAQRAFRRIGIFGLVMRLHGEAERDRHAVLVVGPVRSPGRLTSVLDTTVEQLREAPRRQ